MPVVYKGCHFCKSIQGYRLNDWTPDSDVHKIASLYILASPSYSRSMKAAAKPHSVNWRAVSIEWRKYMRSMMK